MNNIIEYKDIAKFLLEDKVVAMPTDTIYGLSASINSDKAIKFIFSLKERPINKTMIILVSSLEEALSFWKEEDYSIIKDLISNYPDTKLTMVAKHNGSKVNSLLISEDGYIAIRIVKDKRLIDLLKDSGPIASTSANKHQSKEIFDYKSCNDVFGDVKDLYYVDDKSLSITSSTIVRIRKKNIEILRGSLNNKGI